MKIVLLVSITAMLVLEVVSRKFGASLFAIYALVLCLIVLAVGAYEAWSKKRGVLGWIANIVASAFGAFLAIPVLVFGMKIVVPRIESAIAPQILDYAVAAVGTSVLVILSWLPIRIVDLFRRH